jgi:CheY-like chemotaxis protein
MAKKTIMVVDDEPDNITIVKNILEANNYNVISAVNGDNCLKKLKSREKPDLILMDIMMPGTPVSQIIPQIKEFKIVYLTVVRISEAKKQGLLGQKNVVDFIQKPFDINELLEKVKKIVG